MKKYFYFCMLISMLAPMSLYSVEQEYFAKEISIELTDGNSNYFCRKPKNYLKDLASTLSHGVVSTASSLYQTAKRVAPHLKDGIGTVSHYAHEGLEKIDGDALARIIKASADVAIVSAPVLGSLIGVEIPTSTLEKISNYATPDNVNLVLQMAKNLTGASEAVFYTDPNATSEPTNVETAGEVVKNAAETVKALSEYLQKNEGKLSKNEENEVKKAIQDGLKIMEEVR